MLEKVEKSSLNLTFLISQFGMMQISKLSSLSGELMTVLIYMSLSLYNLTFCFKREVLSKPFDSFLNKFSYVLVLINLPISLFNAKSLYTFFFTIRTVDSDWQLSDSFVTEISSFSFILYSQMETFTSSLSFFKYVLAKMLSFMVYFSKSKQSRKLIIFSLFSSKIEFKHGYPCGYLSSSLCKSSCSLSLSGDLTILK